MPDKLPDIAAISGATIAVGTGVACDAVHIHYFTLNDIGVAFGVLSGLLSTIFYIVKLYKTLKNKDTPTEEDN